MPLAWDERMRLLRVVGLAEQVLDASSSVASDAAKAGLGDQVVFLMREVQAVLESSDAGAAAEFERMVMHGPDAELAPELQAAALVGWVKAELTTQALGDKRAEDEANRPRKKQTLGFTFRSPITREQPVAEPPRSEGS